MVMEQSESSLGLRLFCKCPAPRLSTLPPVEPFGWSLATATAPCRCCPGSYAHTAPSTSVH